jgi:hypothetical protein
MKRQLHLNLLDNGDRRLLSQFDSFKTQNWKLSTSPRCSANCHEGPYASRRQESLDAIEALRLC